MDGIALESLLENFATRRSSRRRTGKPSSTQGSPMSGSPNSGSLTEITSQANLPQTKERVLTSPRIKDLSRKEWSSAAELNENSLNSQKSQSDMEDKMAQSQNSHEDEMNTSRNEDSRGLRNPAKRTANITTTARSFDNDDEEEDVQDNNEEEAQKLREASKKVLRFQNSRGSISSGENQKSPGPSATLRRQLTFDEETDRYPDDPTNEDLLQVLLTSQTSPKRNLGRRHTLPTKVPKTEKGDDDQWAELQVKTPNQAAQDLGTVPEREGAGRPPSKPVFDFSDISHNLKQSGGQDPNSTSAEGKMKPPVSSAQVTQPANSHLERSGENVPVNNNKPVVFKTETTGLFFSFFKRLGDMSKLQSSRDTNKPTGTGV